MAFVGFIAECSDTDHWGAMQGTSWKCYAYLGFIGGSKTPFKRTLERDPALC